MIEKSSIFGINSSLCTIFLLIVSTYVVYGSMFAHPFIDYDDYRIILERIESYDGISRETIKKLFVDEFPREEPLLFRDFSYLINAEIFGPLNASGYLIGNFLLHVSVAFMVFRVTFLLFNNLNVAILAAFFFTIHPIHVESVAWISSRKDPLYALFYLLSFATYIKYFENTSKLRLVTSVLFFVIALFSKSAAISFLPLVICYRFTVAKKNRCSFQEILYYLSLTIITVWYITWYTGILKEFGILQATKSTFERDWLVWTLSACTYITFYLKKLLFPLESAIFYEYPASVILFTNKIFLVLSLVLIMGSSLLSIYLYHKKYLRLVFLIMFFICGLLPYLEFAQVNIFVAERYLYVSSIPFCILVALIFSDQFAKNINNKVSRMSVISVLVAISFFWSYRTVQATKIWENTESFWINNLKVSPGRLEPYSGLMRYYEKASVYLVDDNLEKEYLSKAIKIGDQAFDRFCPTRQNCTPILYHVTATMAELEWSLHNYDKAEMYFKATFTLKPDFIESRYMYTGFLLQQKRYQDANEQVNFIEPRLHKYRHSSLIEKFKTEFKPAIEKGLDIEK